MRTEVRNRLLMLGGEVVAEFPDRAGVRRWVVLRPNDSGGVLMIEFEHDEALDTDAYFGPDDVRELARRDFESLDAAVDALSETGLDTNRFDAPWKTDYPL